MDLAKQKRSANFAGVMVKALPKKWSEGSLMVVRLKREFGVNPRLSPQL